MAVFIEINGLNFMADTDKKLWIDASSEKTAKAIQETPEIVLDIINKARYNPKWISELNWILIDLEYWYLEMTHGEYSMESLLENPFVPEQVKLDAMELVASKTDKNKTDEKEQNCRKQLDGYVYLLSLGTGEFKIGKARDVPKRVSQINLLLPQEASIDHIISSNDYSYAEILLHEKYGHARLNGEWFSLTGKEVNEIKSISELNF